VKIFKILPAAEWRAALETGRFAGSEADRRDGFIHFSTGTQLAETARRHFAGQDGLLVLEVAAEGLGAALKWEPSRGGELFPHLYGPLPFDRVAAVAPLRGEGRAEP
jgi:uncharacterized protein (DUF952 family)